MTTVPAYIIELTKDKINLTLAGQVEMVQFPEDVFRLVLGTYRPSSNIQEHFKIILRLLYDECKKRNIRPQRSLTYQLRSTLGISEDAPKEEPRILQVVQKKGMSSSGAKANQQAFCRYSLDPIYEFHRVEKDRQEGKHQGYIDFMGYEFPNPYALTYASITGDTSIFTRVPCGSGHEIIKNLTSKESTSHTYTITYEGVDYSYSGTYDFVCDEAILKNVPLYQTQKCQETCRLCELHIENVKRRTDPNYNKSKEEQGYDADVRATNKLLHDIRDNEIDWKEPHKTFIIQCLTLILDSIQGPKRYKYYVDLIKQGPDFCENTTKALFNFRRMVTPQEDNKNTPMTKEEVVGEVVVAETLKDSLEVKFDAVSLEKPFVPQADKLEQFEKVREKLAAEKLEQLAIAAQFLDKDKQATSARFKALAITAEPLFEPKGPEPATETPQENPAYSVSDNSDRKQPYSKNRLPF